MKLAGNVLYSEVLFFQERVHLPTILERFRSKTCGYFMYLINDDFFGIIFREPFTLLMHGLPKRVYQH